MHVFDWSSFERCYHRTINECTSGFLLCDLPALTLVLVHKIAVWASIQESAVDLESEIFDQSLPLGVHVFMYNSNLQSTFSYHSSSSFFHLSKHCNHSKKMISYKHSNTSCLGYSHPQVPPHCSLSARRLSHKPSLIGKPSSKSKSSVYPVSSARDSFSLFVVSVTCRKLQQYDHQTPIST
jgi:hypothetical protein